MSPLPTLATFSIAATTSGGVGTKITSGDRSGAWVAACSAERGAARVRARARINEDITRIIRLLLLGGSLYREIASTPEDGSQRKLEFSEREGIAQLLGLRGNRALA